MSARRVLLFLLPVTVSVLVTAGSLSAAVPEVLIPVGAVTASSADQAEPWHAFDADLRTQWRSAAGKAQWLAVDLGAVYPLKEAVIFHAGYSPARKNQWNLNLQDFELRGGVRPDQLVSLERVTDNAATIAGGASILSGGGKPVRFLRLDISRTRDDRARVAEVRITLLDAQGREQRVRAQFSITPDEKQALQFHLVPHAGIAIAGLWRYDPETIEDCIVRTFRAAVRDLNDASGYGFAAGQVPLYEPLENRHAELWKNIETLVRAGRWEIAGGNYVSFEPAMTSGESVVRQFLQGKRFYREKFGVDVKTCWLPGAQSHPRTLPQILQLCGITSYICGSGAPYPVFVWEGPDGSQVLAVQPPATTAAAQVIAASARTFRQTGVSHALVSMGGEAHGGAPSAKDATALLGALKAAGTSARVSRFDRFAEAALTQTARMPAVRAEFGAGKPGIYTTGGRIKQGTRSAESRLRAAETFAAVAGRYQPNPSDLLRSAWNFVLFNQAVGITSGNVIPSVYEDAMGLHSSVEEIAESILDEALRGLLLHIDTRGMVNPVVVFNSLGWERNGQVLVPLPAQGGGSWLVRDVEGRIGRGQVVFDPDTQSNKLLFVARNVPAFGYRLYSVVPSPQEVSNPMRAENGVLESPAFKVTFTAGSGDIESIQAKQLAWKVLTGEGNQIQVFEDLGDSAGNFDLTGRTWTLGPHIRMEVIERGPVRVGIRLRNKLLGQYTTFVREVFLTDGLPWIECRTHIEWNSEKKLVKVAFPVAVGTKTSTWEVPYGTVERANDGAERPALRWVDVSDQKYGVALLNQSRYGYDVKGNMLRLSLLRSPTWPAHNDDGGTHRIPYALYPHVGSWKDGNVMTRAHEFNTPLVAVPVDRHSGALPPQASFFSVTPDNVLLTAVKAAESGKGIVLRLVESEGKPATASLRSHWFLRGVYQTDLLEKNERPLSTDGASVKLSFRPYEIKTVFLKNWGYAPLR